MLGQIVLLASRYHFKNEKCSHLQSWYFYLFKAYPANIHKAKNGPFTQVSSTLQKSDVSSLFALHAYILLFTTTKSILSFSPKPPRPGIIKSWSSSINQMMYVFVVINNPKSLTQGKKLRHFFSYISLLGSGAQALKLYVHQIFRLQGFLLLQENFTKPCLPRQSCLS